MLALAGLVFVLTRDHYEHSAPAMLPGYKKAHTDVAAFVNIIQSGLTVTKAAVQTHYDLASRYQLPARVVLAKVLAQLNSSGMSKYQLVK
jgi:hypothetical protein